MTAGAPGEGEPGTPAPDPPAPAASWENAVASLSPELRENPAMKNIESFEKLATEFVTQNALVGRDKVVRPKDDSPEEMGRFYSDLGRPDTHEGYDLGDFAPPEGMPWDKDLQAGMMEDLWEAGASNKMVNQTIRAFAERQKSYYDEAMQQMQTGRLESDAALKTEWGPSYEPNLEFAKRAFNFMFGEQANQMEWVQLGDGRQVGNHPDFLRGLAAAGKALHEHGLLGDKTTSVPVMTPDQAQSEIEELESDPEFGALLAGKKTQNHPKVKRWNNLMDIKHAAP